MQWKRITYLVGLGIALILGTLLLVGVYISPQDDLVKSSVVVAISGGDTKARALEAVKLYQQGWAPRLLFSGAAQDPSSESNAAVMRQIAINAGVPPDVITIEEQSDNTRENAQMSAELIAALGYQSIILVTSPYHQRRAYLEFKSQLPESITVINHSAPDDRWSRSQWWRSPFGWDITISEIPKILYTLTQTN